MITLETNKVWTGDGYGASRAITLNQIRRTGMVALYERMDADEKHQGYELIVIKVVPAGTKLPNNTVTLEDKEHYPGSSQFGRSAWAIIDLKAANIRFDELVNKGLAVDNNENVKSVEVKNSATKISDGEFTIKEFATANNLEYPVAYVTLKEKIEAGEVELVRKESRGQGRPTSIYKKKS